MRDNIDDFTARFRITGRTVDHSSESYGRGHTVKTLFAYVQKIEYPGLSLDHLYREGAAGSLHPQSESCAERTND